MPHHEQHSGFTANPFPSKRQTFKLGANSLTGRISSGLGNLVQLQTIEPSGNGLTGNDPVENGLTVNNLLSGLICTFIFWFNFCFLQTEANKSFRVLFLQFTRVGPQDVVTLYRYPEIVLVPFFLVPCFSCFPFYSLVTSISSRMLA